MLSGLRRITAAALAAGVLAGTAGCGSEEVSPSAIARAANVTAAVDGVRMKMSISMTLPGLGQITLPARGESDLEGKRFALTMDLSGFGGLAGLAGDDLDLELVYANRALFVRPPAVKELRLPDGKRWARIDVFRLAKTIGLDLAALAPLANPDPAAQLRLLKAASDIKKVGEERVGGVQTTHYRGTMRMGDLVKAVPAAQRERVRKAIDQLLKLSDDAEDTPTTFDVWVDDRSRVRRMIQSGSFPVQPGESPAKMTIRMDLTDFGAEVVVKAPPRSQVVDVTDSVAKVVRSFAPTRP